MNSSLPTMNKAARYLIIQICSGKKNEQMLEAAGEVIPQLLSLLSVEAQDRLNCYVRPCCESMSILFEILS